jgi:hypothetical protein
VSDYVQEVSRIAKEAKGTSDTDVVLLEEATRLADLHGDVPLGLKVRLRLIQAAERTGNYEQVLVAFSWCLAQIDRDEALRIAMQRRVLWYYKWATASLCKYSQVSREQIEHSFADMADRFQRAGFGDGAVHKCRAFASIRLGDLSALGEARLRWVASPRDGISDCAACQADGTVECDLEIGDIKAALRAAEPIIRGNLKCTSIPCATFGRLLLPVLKLGAPKMADLLHAGSIRQTLSQRDFLESIGDHCAYLAITGQIAKAVRVFETGMAWVMIARRTWDRMIFLEKAVVLFERLAQTGQGPMQLKIPNNAIFHRDDDTYEPLVIAQGLHQMRGELAGEFNRRNGNTYMDVRYGRFREMVAAIPPTKPDEADPAAAI